jgi:uncharacterized FlaG/YvyC family protein
MSDKIEAQISHAGNALPVTLGRVDEAQAAQVAAAKTEKVEGNSTPQNERSAKDAAGVKINGKGMRPLGDVTLRFEIDSQTHDVTILILDRASQKVVRTIPPEEMARLDPGELLQLFA